MTAVLGIDLGKTTGWGLLGRPKVLSGSFEVVKRWAPLGAQLLTLEACLHGLIARHRPDVLACAKPFVRRGAGGAMIDTPQNLVPMFAGFAVLHMLAAAMGVPLETIEESDARSIMLGRDMPQGSARVKLAIWNACRARGWPVEDGDGHHDTDALCVGSAIVERLDPARAYETTPLFQAMPTMRMRRGRRAA